MRNTIIVSLLCAAMLLVVPEAQARTDKQQAGSLFRAGNKLYTRGDVKGALEKFLAARKLFPSFKLDMNIATCLYDLGRHADAARELERFLEKAEKAPSRIVKEAQVKLVKLRKTLASIKLSCNEAGATILVDGQEIGRTPLRRRIYLRPGTHQLKLMKEGHAWFSREIELKIDQHRKMEVKLQPKVAAAPAPAAVPAPAPTPTPASATRPAAMVAAAGDPAEAQINDHPGQEDPDPLEQPVPGGGLFVNAVAGPYWASYGDYSGEVTAALEVGGDVGWLWRINRRMGVYAHATVLYDSVQYSSSTDDYQMGFLNLFFGGGGRLYFFSGSKLWADLRVGVGPALLLGATENIFPLKKGALEGAPTGFALRSSLGIGWTFYRGLSVTFKPVGIEYMPAIDAFLPEITGIFRYQLAVALGWQM